MCTACVNLTVWIPACAGMTGPREVAAARALCHNAAMSIVKLYFVCGLAMALVALWDYRKLARTAQRLARPAPKTGSQFSKIALDTRNMAVMVLFAFFLWPAVVYMELFGRGRG